MLERALIDHGSPTLANMKVGSLFTSSCADAAGFRAEFRRVQAALESRGVSLTILRVQQERALVYVYRQEALAALLAQADVQAFLRAMGYGDTSPDGALAFLRQRLAESPCFPHEIGVFLGYPLSDVIAFMRDGGAAADAADAGRHTRTSAKQCAFSSATRRAARHTRRFSALGGRLNG